MSAPQFTPGPWVADYCDVEEVWHVDAGAYPFGSTICEVDKRTLREGDAKANARLIAAAPALFDALQELAWAVATTVMPEASCERLLPLTMKAKSALVKARGEQ